MTTQQSVDENIDTSLNTFFNWISFRIPMLLFPVFLTVYAKTLDMYSRFCAQSTRVIQSIFDSFKHEVISFTKYGDVYVPFVHYQGKETILHNYQSPWVYDTNTSNFTSYECTKHFSHLPYLGAAVSYTGNGEFDYSYDMTEWISNQSVTSTDAFVPFQVIVAAWAQTNNLTFYSSDYSGYRITVMTLHGEEETYDLATGEKLEFVEDSNEADGSVEEVDTMEAVSSTAAAEAVEAVDAEQNVKTPTASDELEEGEIPRETSTSVESEESSGVKDKSA